jgi:hypothetical protein
VKLVVNFDVQPGTTYDVYVDFDAHRSIFVHEAGASGKYILRPTVRAYDRLETGSISGTFGVAGPTGPTGPLPAPLAGAVVTAQTVSGGVPTVVRSTTTDASGHYVLDLLPRGGTYHVVSQPVSFDAGGSAVASYEPKASAGIPITVAAPVQTYDALFTVATATGALSGSVTPVAVIPQVDELDALLPFDVGGIPQPFVVRSVTATVSAGAESYDMAALPTATPSRTYTVVGRRRSVDTSGTETVVSSAAVTAAVPAGGTGTANVAFPP